MRRFTAASESPPKAIRTDLKFDMLLGPVGIASGESRAWLVPLRIPEKKLIGLTTTTDQKESLYVVGETVYRDIFGFGWLTRFFYTVDIVRLLKGAYQPSLGAVRDLAENSISFSVVWQDFKNPLNSAT